MCVSNWLNERDGVKMVFSIEFKFGKYVVGKCCNIHINFGTKWPMGPVFRQFCDRHHWKNQKSNETDGTI